MPKVNGYCLSWTRYICYVVWTAGVACSLFLLCKCWMDATMDAAIEHKLKAVTSNLQANFDKVIADALMIYDADKTGRVDYASKDLGAEIVSIRDTQPIAKHWTSSYFGLRSCATVVPPSTILEANTQPGNCWPFAGATGTAVIKLICPVFITGITYEHVSKSLVMNEDISSAPIEFRLTALSNPDDTAGSNLGKFVYDKDGPPIQYFPVEKTCNGPYKFVEFTILSNNGNEDSTCVYRVRIHGTVQK